MQSGSCEHSFPCATVQWMLMLAISMLKSICNLGAWAHVLYASSVETWLQGSQNAALWGQSIISASGFLYACSLTDFCSSVQRQWEIKPFTCDTFRQYLGAKSCLVTYLKPTDGFIVVYSGHTVGKTSHKNYLNFAFGKRKTKVFAQHWACSRNWISLSYLAVVVMLQILAW